MSRSKYGRRALRPYSEALSEAGRDPSAPQPLCRWQPETYVDYDEDSIPDEFEAQELCIECPLFELCFDNARRTHPGWGVWGGVAWVNGRQWHLATEEEKRSTISELNA